MTLRRRVRIFQKALLDTLREASPMKEYDTASLGALVLLAQAINMADDMGAFDDDLSEVREDEPAEG